MDTTTRAVERLTEHHTEIEDGHPVEWPPLLEWLERSIHEVTGRTGGSGEGGIPFNEDAYRLKRRITNRLRNFYKAMFLPWRDTDLVTATREAWEYTVNERKGQRLDDAQWEFIGDEFIDWVHRIEAEDNRPKSLPLEACPRCSARRVYPGKDSDDEPTYLLEPAHPDDSPKPAVVVEWDDGRLPVAECRNPGCDGHWVGWKAMAELGFTLGASQDLAILEACGIKLELAI